MCKVSSLTSFREVSLTAEGRKRARGWQVGVILRRDCGVQWTQRDRDGVFCSYGITYSCNGVCAASLNADVLPLPSIGEKLLLDLPTIDGGRARIDNYAGKFVLVDFWATWCTPCMKKMPTLKKLAEKHADDLVIVGIDMDRDVEKGKAKIIEEDLSWPQVSCVEATRGHPDLWHAATGVSSIPVIIIADRDGIIRWIGGSWGMEKALDEVMASDDAAASG